MRCYPILMMMVMGVCAGAWAEEAPSTTMVTEVVEDECEPQPLMADDTIFPLRFAAAIPVGMRHFDGSYDIRREVGIQFLGAPLAPEFYGLAVSPFFSDFTSSDFYGVFVGWQSQIDNVYGMQLALVNISGELNPELFASSGNCYGAQAALMNSADTAFVQLGAVGNLASELSGFQVSALLNKTDVLYGMQWSGINAIFNAGDSCGAQVGIFNAAMGYSDASDLVQLGLFNGAEDVTRMRQVGLCNAIEANNMGFQFGLLNRATGTGWQIGLLNFSESAWLPFCPFLLYSAPAAPEGLEGLNALCTEQ